MSGFKCLYCEIKFYRDLDYLEHVRVEHSGKQAGSAVRVSVFTIPCEYCSKTFHTTEGYAAHLLECAHAQVISGTSPKTSMPASCLPTDSKARKNIPLARGCFDYFPAALAAVAEVSQAGNEKHNPGEELHHARGKSNDHADCIMRHLADRGALDPTDNLRHSAKVAWRALALLQEELEAAGAPLARGARLPVVAVKPVCIDGCTCSRNAVPACQSCVNLADKWGSTTLACTCLQGECNASKHISKESK